MLRLEAHRLGRDRARAGLKYGAILCDPPWRYDNDGVRGAAANHYPTLSLTELLEFPIDSYAADNCACFLWTTGPMLPVALSLLAGWGFQYRSLAFVWIKTTPRGKVVFGPGFWTRAGAELVLLGTRGRVRRRSASVPQVLISERREHSRKPDELYGLIEQLVEGPYLELFARTAAPGWDSLGDEVGRFQLGG